MRLAIVVAAFTATIVVGGCQSRSSGDSHRCVVTPNQTVECS